MTRPHVFIEGGLRFEFDSAWQVCNWDDIEYRAGFHRLARTAALDFVALLAGAPWLIEVSDFRGYRAAGRTQRKSGDFADEVARKVRDTVAGVIWSCDRSGIDSGDLKQFAKALVNRTEKVPVLVWVEEDPPIDPPHAISLGEEIKKRLRGWLNAKVIVHSPAPGRDSPVAGVQASPVA